MLPAMATNFFLRGGSPAADDTPPVGAGSPVGSPVDSSGGEEGSSVDAEASLGARSGARSGASSGRASSGRSSNKSDIQNEQTEGHRNERHSLPTRTQSRHGAPVNFARGAWIWDMRSGGAL